jgi:hypothetical protein
MWKIKHVLHLLQFLLVWLHPQVKEKYHLSIHIEIHLLNIILLQDTSPFNYYSCMVVFSDEKLQYLHVESYVDWVK